jgi:transposase
VAEVARAYGVARSWICELLARYQAEGEAAFEPRSRRPRTSPAALGHPTVELIVRLRKETVRPRPGRRAGHDLLAPGAR